MLPILCSPRAFLVSKHFLTPGDLADGRLSNVMSDGRLELFDQSVPLAEGGAYTPPAPLAAMPLQAAAADDDVDD